MATSDSPGNIEWSRDEPPQSGDPRMDYLLECYRITQHELLLRYADRESWLKIQLISQIVLLALAQGVEIFGVKTSNPLPNMLAFSIGTSFVIACLYHVDDNIISYMSSYLRALSQAESELRPGQVLILNWHASEQVKELVHKVVPLRYFAQVVAFLLIPFGVFVFRVSSFASRETLELIAIAEIVMDVIFLVLIAIVILVSYLRRRKAFLKPTQEILRTRDLPGHGS
jgi:hypothetical protein